MWKFRLRSWTFVWRHEDTCFFEAAPRNRSLPEANITLVTSSIHFAGGRIELGVALIRTSPTTLFASSCDSRRPTISFGTRHLRSSSWPSVNSPSSNPSIEPVEGHACPRNWRGISCVDRADGDFEMADTDKSPISTLNNLTRKLRLLQTASKDAARKWAQRTRALAK